jgi:hypothetical protein
MAIIHAQNTLSTTAEALGAPASGLVRQLHIKNTDASIIVYVGNSADVTSSTGFPIAAGATLVLEGVDPKAVYMIAASGTPVVAWLGTN